MLFIILISVCIIEVVINKLLIEQNHLISHSDHVVKNLQLRIGLLIYVGRSVQLR